MLLWFCVQNMSQQSDVADILGGFKPVDAQFVYFPLYKEFEDLFSRTFSMKVFIFVFYLYFMCNFVNMLNVLMLNREM